MTDASKTLRNRERGPMIFRAVAVVLLSLAPAVAARAQQPPGEDPAARDVIRMLQDVSRALQAGNPSSFLRFFDHKQFAGYGTLESHIVALTTQSDIASSMDVVEIERSDDGYRARVDWLLQLTVKETPGPLEVRREALRITAAKIKPGSWRIVGLEPLDFFRPQGSAKRN